MSINVPAFQSFFRVFLPHFVVAKLAISSIRVKGAFPTAGHQTPVGHLWTGSFLANSEKY